MADIKTGYTLRELIFAGFTGSDLKKMVWKNIQNDLIH